MTSLTNLNKILARYYTQTYAIKSVFKCFYIRNAFIMNIA